MAGEIVSRFERKGFKLVAAKFMQIPEDLARRHYAVHEGEHFFEPLVKFLSCGPALVMVWQAEDIVKMARRMMGKTFGHDAEPGTIRGDLSCSTRYNLVHGSDSPESAEREIKLYFKPKEILEYEFPDGEWLRIPR